MDIDLLTLLKLNVPIEVALVSHSPDGSKSLLSTKQVDWRFVLSHGGINVSLELPGVDAKSKLSVGIIQVKKKNSFCNFKQGFYGSFTKD